MVQPVRRQGLTAETLAAQGVVTVLTSHKRCSMRLAVSLKLQSLGSKPPQPHPTLLLMVRVLVQCQMKQQISSPQRKAQVLQDQMAHPQSLSARPLVHVTCMLGLSCAALCCVVCFTVLDCSMTTSVQTSTCSHCCIPPVLYKLCMPSVSFSVQLKVA